MEKFYVVLFNEVNK